MDQQVNGLSEALHALDRTLVVYDNRLDPSQIAPVQAWQGRYGQRGALTSRIVEFLQRHAPGWVRTDALESFLTADLSIHFETPNLRRSWRRNTLLSRLKVLARQGAVERCEGPPDDSSGHRFWRIRQDHLPSLSELQAMAEATA